MHICRIRVLVVGFSLVAIPSASLAQQVFNSAQDCNSRYEELVQRRRDISHQSFDCVSGEPVWGERQTCSIGNGEPHLYTEQTAYVQCEPFEVSTCEVETEIRAVKRTCDQMMSELAEKVKLEGDQNAANDIQTVIDTGGTTADNAQVLLNEANLRRQAMGVPKTMFLGVYTNETLLKAVGENPSLASELANSFLNTLPTNEFAGFTSMLNNVRQNAPNAYSLVNKGLKGLFQSYDPESDTQLEDEDMAKLTDFIIDKTSDKLMSEDAGIRIIQELALSAILETHTQLQEKMLEAFNNFNADIEASYEPMDQNYNLVRQAENWVRDRSIEREQSQPTSQTTSQPMEASVTACEQSTGVGSILSSTSGNTATRWSHGLDVCLCETGLDKYDGLVDDSTPGADQFYSCMAGYGLGHDRP